MTRSQKKRKRRKVALEREIKKLARMLRDGTPEEHGALSRLCVSVNCKAYFANGRARRIWKALDRICWKWLFRFNRKSRPCESSEVPF